MQIDNEVATLIALLSSSLTLSSLSCLLFYLMLFSSLLFYSMLFYSNLSMLLYCIASRILSYLVFDFTVLIALLYTQKEPEAFAFLKVYVESVLA